MNLKPATKFLGEKYFEQTLQMLVKCQMRLQEFSEHFCQCRNKCFTLEF